MRDKILFYAEDEQNAPTLNRRMKALVRHSFAVDESCARLFEFYAMTNTEWHAHV